MKRFLALLITLSMLSVACAPAQSVTAPASAATEQPKQTEAATPEPTQEPTPAPTPEPVGAAPIDLLNAPYNAFSNVVFPKGYTVYGARYDCAQPEKGLKELYSLFLTAEGDKPEIVRYFAGLLGITDEAMLKEKTDAIEKDGFLQIDGTYNGTPAFVQLKQTVAGADYQECADVDGCRAELAININPDQSQQYQRFVMANVNQNVFGDLADRFSDDAVIQALMACYVNTQKPELTEFYVLYQADDAASLEKEVASKLTTNWQDEKSNSLGLTYGKIEAGLRFDAANKTVHVSFRPNDNSTAAGKFALSDKSLAKLGFQYDANAHLAIYEDKSQNIQVAIAHPDWNYVETWNVLVFCDYNKHSVMFQYFEKEDRFMVTADSGGHLTGSNFDLKTNSFDAGFPDAQEMQSVFENVLGSGDGDIRERMLDVFTKLLQERFGMTWQELYKLPVW